MISGHAAARGMTCGLAGFLLVALLIPVLVPAAPGCDSLNAEARVAPGSGDEGLETVDGSTASSRLGSVADPSWGASHLDGDRNDGSSGVDQGGQWEDGASVGCHSSVGRSWPLHLLVMIVPARVLRERLLDHRIRRRIVEEVRRRPGIHHRELLRFLGVSNGTLAYHLRQLERGGYLRFSRAHGRKFLWASQDEVDGELLLMTDRERELLALVSEFHLARIDDLSLRSGLKPSSVEYHINRLRALGIVQAWRDGHALVFSCSKAAETLKVCTTNHSLA
jgi:DNA-binding MarR family transcriptional regulator